MPDPPSEAAASRTCRTRRRVRCEDAADGALGRRGRLRGDRLRPMGAGAPAGGAGRRLPHRAGRFELEDGGARSAPAWGACRRGTTATRRERRAAASPDPEGTSEPESRYPHRYVRQPSSGDSFVGLPGSSPGGPQSRNRSCSSRFARWVGLLPSSRLWSPPTSGTGCGQDRCRRSAGCGGATVAGRSTTAVTCSCTHARSSGCILLRDASSRRSNDSGRSGLTR